MDRRRILILSTRCPYPLIGGDRIRIFRISELLARSYDVTLLVLNEGRVAGEHVAAIQRSGIRTRFFEYPLARFRLNAALGLISQLPLQSHYYYFRQVQRWIDEHSHEFDLVLCNHIRSAAYMQSRDIPKIIDLHDAISLNYKRAGPYAPTFWHRVYGIERSRVLRQEQAAVEAFDMALIVSPVDKAYLVSHGADARKIEVLPVAVSDELLVATEEPEDDTVVFVGRMNTVANADAAVYFCREVFPLVRREFPQMRFQIVGADPTPAVKELGTAEAVTVTGKVEEYLPYLKRARVVVDPMRFGAGMQNKVVEAMALGKAVVATPLAAEGIGGVPGVHYLTGSTATELAESVNRVARDRALRLELGNMARMFVREHYSWSTVGQKLLTAVSRVLADRP